MKLIDIIQSENVFIDVAAPTKLRLLRDLAERAARRVPVDPGVISAALQKREQLGSTGIGNGVAIPHAYVPVLTAPLVLFARLKKPIDFESIDDGPVDIVFVILAPAENGSAHLSLLSLIARKAQSQTWLGTVRSAKSSEAIAASLTEEAGRDGDLI